MITIDDLKNGIRPRITEAEFAQLRGCKRATLQRERWQGNGIPYQKDGNNRVYYPSEAVLSYLNKPCYQSTSQYDTRIADEHLAIARAAKQKRKNKKHGKY